MNIPINKNIEEEYKDEFVKGFSLRESITIGIAILIVILVGVFCWWKFKIAINICAYIGMPFAAPVLLLGFKKPYGMHLEKFLKEVIWEKKTKLLVYEASEAPETDEYFSMKSNGDLTNYEKKISRKEKLKICCEKTLKRIGRNVKRN